MGLIVLACVAAGYTLALSLIRAGRKYQIRGFAGASK